MIEDIALIGLCGSRGLRQPWRKLVTSVVRSLAEAGRSIAVGCARGADAMGLHACFTDTGELRVPRLDVFAAFGPDGDGAWKHSAVELVTRVAQHPMAKKDTDLEPRIAVNWWAGGAPPTPLVPRLKGRSAAMVTTVNMSGDGTCPGRQGQVQGCGLVAFVVGGPSKSPGTWSTIRLAAKRGIPIVAFPCDCNLRCFPSLGQGRWMTAGKGVWEHGWRWLPASRAIPRRSGGRHERARQSEPESDDEHVGAIEGILSALLGWKKASPRRRTVELDFPFFSNVRNYLYEQNCPNLITGKEV